MLLPSSIVIQRPRPLCQFHDGLSVDVLRKCYCHCTMNEKASAQVGGLWREHVCRSVGDVQNVLKSHCLLFSLAEEDFDVHNSPTEGDLRARLEGVGMV